MARVKTFANGGSVSPADINNMRADMEGTLVWRPIVRRTSRLSADGAGGRPPVSGSMLGRFFGFSALDIEIASGGHTVDFDVAAMAFRLDPGDLEGRRGRCRVRAHVASNNEATMSAQMSFGVYPVVALTSVADGMNYTVTTVPMGGSTALVETATSAVAEGLSGEFPYPQEGLYIFGMTGVGTIPATHESFVLVTLEARRAG